jgi:fatty-acyl-CoA synthase
VNSALGAWVRALERTAPVERGEASILPILLDELAARFDAHPALVDEEQPLSYRALAEQARRYARWGLASGLQPGDVVALLMPNCAQYMPIWLGLSRIGAVVALLNTQLGGELLAHAVRVAGARCLIVGSGLSAALASAQLPASVVCWAQAPDAPQLPRLDRLIETLPAAPLSPTEAVTPALSAPALYIYTSGTTGLPKAAVVSHRRVLQWSHWFAGMMDTRASDRMYDCLPMYHSIGGVVATGATLVAGGTVVLRKRFSAREFWSDVCREGCTLFQYIGELCRYLLASAPQPLETAHSLRLVCGNGLRGEVWLPFKERFRIPEILEYYASTEGSFSLYNCEGRPGAIGRIPAFLSHRVPVRLVKHDPDTEQPMRDASGHCVRCGPNEIGEAIGQLREANGRERSRFEGYADAAASARKLLHGVFAPGDVWFESGDLMRQDEQGFFYFIDRVGDTFRWKGENVSTSEVTAVLVGCRGVTDAAVYGVTLPGTEGRAGMAALMIDEHFDPGTFAAELLARLPEYARPLLLRIVTGLELTGTFKLRKRELAREGYDPAAVADALYVYDKAAAAYQRLDATLHAQLCAGALRL